MINPEHTRIWLYFQDEEVTRIYHLSASIPQLIGPQALEAERKGLSCTYLLPLARFQTFEYLASFWLIPLKIGLCLENAWPPPASEESQIFR
jgi:hypothetical protein